MKVLKTFEIIEQLTKAMRENNQRLINLYAYELATRLYVPGTKTTFEEILVGFGYQEIEQDPRQISIEEYMRGRKQDDRKSESGTSR